MIDISKGTTAGKKCSWNLKIFFKEDQTNGPRSWIHIASQFVLFFGKDYYFSKLPHFIWWSILYDDNTKVWQQRRGDPSEFVANILTDQIT